MLPTTPIEHKAFYHITRTCSGVVLDSYEIAKELAGKATTKTGFSVEVNVNEKKYETGEKASEGFLKNMKVVFDDFIPKWNYTFKFES